MLEGLIIFLQIHNDNTGILNFVQKLGKENGLETPFKKAYVCLLHWTASSILGSPAPSYCGCLFTLIRVRL